MLEIQLDWDCLFQKALVEKMNGTISAEYNNEMLNICIVFDL